MEKYESRYKLSPIDSYFCNELAKMYEPLIYGGDYADPQPEGIYYRILYKPGEKTFCVQYYVYWLDQECLGLLPIADHKYDYEPIYVYLKPPTEFLVGIVNAGYSKGLGISCRFHKTEIRMREYEIRDFNEYQFNYKTSPEPIYPFGGSEGSNGTTCVKKYPITGAIYTNELRPMFGITSCSHVFSGAEKDLRGKILNIPLKRLDDQVLCQWYFEHHKEDREEPFGHDVSGAFDFPYIKYCEPKPKLKPISV